mgnify:CR=1 FL=1
MLLSEYKIGENKVMNKKNKILVGCLSLLLVLSVGYALFSETITINGTATAKGNFDINHLKERRKALRNQAPQLPFSPCM